MGVKKSAQVFMPVSKKTRIQIQNSGSKTLSLSWFQALFQDKKSEYFQKDMRDSVYFL